MDLMDIETEVEICIQRVRVIQIMTESLIRSNPDAANAFSLVAHDVEDGMGKVRAALLKQRGATP